MIATTLRRHTSTAIVTAGIVASVHVQAARAADASAWDGDSRSSMRLIVSKDARLNVSAQRAAIEISLAPGWKTYWRYPGDSGVPPTFDWSGSEDVGSVKVLWPAPHRFTDDGGSSIGYKGKLVLPLLISPRDVKALPVLRLKLSYAICEKLCVPADAKAELAIPGGPSAHEATIVAAEALVPVVRKLGEAGPLAIHAIHREPGTPHDRVVVDVTAPEGAVTDLFAEGPTAEWSLPLPAPTHGAPSGQKRYAFDLDGMPAGASPKGAVLTFTLVAADKAIEVATPLD